MSYNSLSNYYYTNFALIHHHKYSLHDIESLIPFEREMYVALIINHSEQQKKNNK